MRWFDAFIDQVPGVQGGAPVVKGTRTPVRTVVAFYYQAYSGDLAQVRDALPHLTEAQVCACLAYYDAHQHEIDEDNRRHEKALESITHPA